MFSENRKLVIEKQFRQLLEELPVLEKELVRFHELEADTALAMKYLYTTMPFSDIGNYSFDTFLDYASHGIYLWKHGAYRKEIPEAVFLNYILYHRINEEEILPCRSFFYKQLKRRTEGLTMKEAVLEVNYWCAEEAAYRSTDARTAAPVTVYNCGYGRCGEESTFTASALRCIGIPARQVYTPRWSHCDDNHAWVEVWCDGSWYFLGACEPEEILNKGWFNSASSRAMLIHSRCFDFIGKDEITDKKELIGIDEITNGEEIIGWEGMVTMLNQLGRYAKTETVTVKVIDSYGHPVRDCRVEFQIMNYSEFYTLAAIRTNENGMAAFTTGLGSLNIHVCLDDNESDLLIDTREQREAVITIKDTSSPVNSWHAFDMIAPVDSPVNNRMPTQLQKIAGEKRYSGAAAKRLDKIKDIRNKDIDKFLNSNPGHKVLKEKLLSVLTVKDQCDMSADILEEHFRYALPYKDTLSSSYNEEIFLKYLLNPRIQNEPIFRYRCCINEYFTELQKEEFKNMPTRIWNYIDTKIRSCEKREHPGLVTTPLGCFKTGTGSIQSKHILFVAVARTLGIPARLAAEDGSMEYWSEGEFHPVLEYVSGTSSLELEAGDDKISWIYYQNYTVGQYVNGSYATLGLDGAEFVNGKLKLSLKPGKYRILTSNRLPNGNIFANEYKLFLKAGEEKTVQLSLRDAKLSDMLENISVNDFTLNQEDGKTVTGSSLTKDGKRILIWLEEGKEPTEHILNELLERKKEFREFAGQLNFIVRSKASLADLSISKVMQTFPGAIILFDNFQENVRTLGRRLYVDPDKLPLIVVTSKELNGIYAASGYNVGTGDLILRLLKEEV